MSDSNQALCDAIAQRIVTSPHHRIPFAEYMDLVLYHPQQGYYATNQVNIGAGGDFFTSPHLGADFGELLAEQFFQMWEILAKPATFTLVEMGAGQGILAGDILRYLHRKYPAFFQSLEYVIIEKSVALKNEQQQRLQKLPLQWKTLEEISTNSINGCFFSNELVDAFPVHQVVIEAGEFKEIYVTYEGNNFVEVIGDISTEKLIEYFKSIKIDLFSQVYPNGYRTEVNLAALEWLNQVAEKLKRGYLLTIDYGYPASRYYHPARRQGTLQCYYRHAHHNDPYIYIGNQDITAHVDFTALEKWGELCGLEKMGFTQQALFLMALGLNERFAAFSTMDATDSQTIQQVLQRRDALHQLISPMGLGNFGVLVQSKGLTEEEKSYPLKGLNVPTDIF